MSSSSHPRVPLKRLFLMQSGVWGIDPDAPSEGVQCVRVADFDRETQRVGEVETYRKLTADELRKCELRYGDLLLEKSGGTALNPVGFVARFVGHSTAVCSNFITRLRPAEGQSSRYWAYSLGAAYVDGRTWPHVKQTTGIQNLDLDSWRAMEFLVPPLATQRAIADFLDRETAKIDALIEKQHKLIGLLKERRRAVAALAVRYGIGGAAVADHPAPAVGVLPEGWTAQPVKHALVSLDGRRIPLSAEERGDRQGEYPYYGASGVIDHVDDFLFDEELVLVSEDGANLLMRSTPIAFTAEGRYWVNNHAHVMRPRFGPARYWAHRIEASDLAPFVTGSAQPKFTADALSKLVISWPIDPSEMTEIVEHLDRETAKIDTLIAKAEQHIALARERRAALITAAVTGQIEVPEAA